MATGSVSANLQNTGMTSSVSSLVNLAMDKFDIYPQVIQRYSDQYKSTLGIDLRMMGARVGIASETHSNFQEDWYIENFTCDGGAVASAAGGTQDITLAADSVDANNRYYPKVGHVIVYKGSGNVLGTIESIDVTVPASPVLTVRAGVVGGTGVVLPAVADGETIAIATNNWGEGTDQPVSTIKKYERLDYYLQILKDTYGITGSQLTNSTWVELAANGETFGYWNIGIADAEARLDAAEEHAFLIGDGGLTTPTAGSIIVSDEADTIRRTKGIIPWIRERGEVLSLDPSTVDYTDFDLIDDYLRTQGNTTTTIMGWVGNQLGRALSNNVHTNIVSGNGDEMSKMMGQYMMGNYDDTDLEARIACLKYNGYQSFDRLYVWKSVASFSNPKGLGSNGYAFPKYGIWFPQDMVKDGASGNLVPNVAIMYKEHNGYSRERELWTDGAAGGDVANYRGENDSKKYFLRSNVGLMFNRPNQGLLFDPEA